MLHMNRAPENMNDPFAEAGADEVSRFQCITSIEVPEEWYNAVLDFVLMYQSRQSLCGGSERAKRVRHTSAAQLCNSVNSIADTTDNQKAYMNDKWITIYVNGVELHATRGNSTTQDNLYVGRFFTDSTEKQFIRCDQHSLNKFDIAHMLRRGAVYTSGNLYSFYPRY